MLIQIYKLVNAINLIVKRNTLTVKSLSFTVNEVLIDVFDTDEISISFSVLSTSDIFSYKYKSNF